jgi:hypothetical protein
MTYVRRLKEAGSWAALPAEIDQSLSRFHDGQSDDIRQAAAQLSHERGGKTLDSISAGFAERLPCGDIPLDEFIVDFTECDCGLHDAGAGLAHLRNQNSGPDFVSLIGQSIAEPLSNIILPSIGFGLAKDQVFSLI